ncbi:hypothetical protein DFH09DRAFT_1302198 [Mycena vulgaris]|nr:hypothetical protein DFH09DRAFT_1302198 [Mycena vulgaris]
MSTANDLTGSTLQAIQGIEAAIADLPRVSQGSSSQIVSWAARIFAMLTAVLVALVPAVAQRFNDLEALALQGQRPATRSGGATPGTSTSTPQSAGRLPRCQKCHARGHLSTECRTTNPAAMRRRVAQNSGTARDVRAAKAAHALMPTLPPTSHAGGSAFTAAQIPMGLAALAADASELRRRADQSRRDKRLRKQRTSTAV